MKVTIESEFKVSAKVMQDQEEDEIQNEFNDNNSQNKDHNDV